MNEAVTQLLSAVEEGDHSAAERLLPLVYEELRRLAAARMAKEPARQTLQPTALVHEAYLRLANGQNSPWRNREHYFAAAAETMRRILVDRARAKAAQKRGGELTRVDFEEAHLAIASRPETLCAIDDAIEALALVAPEKAELVKLRYFVGMTNAEAARALNVSEVTVKRYWTFARSWLFQWLTENKVNPSHD